MEAVISFFSYKNGGAGLGIVVLYWVLWEFFYASTEVNLIIDGLKSVSLLFFRIWALP